MSENSLQAEARTETGKGGARRLRAAGRIPAVIYGRGEPSRSIVVDPRALERVLHASGSGMNTLIDLAFEGSDHVVLLKDLQRDPLRGSYLHADFYEVDLTKVVEVAVPLHFVGRAQGVELGGLLDHPLRELEIQCLPRDIPDSIEVDVSALEIGDSLHVRELTIPDGITVLSDPELSVANVEAPVAEEEVVEEPEEGAAVEGEAAPEEGAEEAPSTGESSD